MKQQRIMMLVFAALTLTLFAASGAFAITTLTVGTNTDVEGGIARVPVIVNDPTRVLGAAFTVKFDKTKLQLVDIESVFFDTFVKLYPADQYTYTEIGIDPVTNTVGGYAEPIVDNDVTGGVRIAAARHTGINPPSTTTLFTLSFQLINAADIGTYSITIEATNINNTAAGYPATGENIPLLVGLADGKTEADIVNNPATAFTNLITAAQASDPNIVKSGTANFVTGGSEVTIEVQFNAGYNLFSFPVSVPADLNTSFTLLNYLDSGFVSKIVAYDGNPLVAQWVTMMGQTKASGEDESIANGRGLVIYMKNPVNKSFTGAAMSKSVAVDLVSGTNVVGFQNPPANMTAFTLLNKLGVNNVIKIQDAEMQTAQWVTMLGQTRAGGTDFPIEGNGKAYVIVMKNMVTGFDIHQ